MDGNMFKSRSLTSAFATSVKEQEKLKDNTKPKDLDLINSICQHSDIVITINGDGSKTTLQVIDAKTMAVLDLEYDGNTTNTLYAGSANISNVGFTEAKAN